TGLSGGARRATRPRERAVGHLTEVSSPQVCAVRGAGDPRGAGIRIAVPIPFRYRPVIVKPGWGSPGHHSAAESRSPYSAEAARAAAYARCPPLPGTASTGQ